MKSRGQLFSGEFMVSYIIFVIALIMILYLWNSNLVEIRASESQQAQNNLAVDVTEQILRTPGSPINWTNQDVLVVGLANDSRILQEGKIQNFVVLMGSDTASLCANGSNYECNRHLLGLGKYDFMFNITYLNGTSLIINNTFCATGRQPENESRRITVTRTALLKEDLVKVYFTMWEK